MKVEKRNWRKAFHVVESFTRFSLFHLPCFYSYPTKQHTYTRNVLTDAGLLQTAKHAQFCQLSTYNNKKEDVKHFQNEMQRTFPLLRKAIAGVEESQFFSLMRKQILSDLQANTNDKSLAGRVDPQIAALVQYVNTSFPQYVTSSSCAGRVSLFHKGVKESPSSAKPSAPDTTEGSEQPASQATAPALERRKRGSFGQGTLYQSHDPLPADPRGVVAASIVPALERFWAWRSTQPSDPLLYTSEVLQLKFEPMILHVLCADVEAAAELLKCGSESGQMNSGIVSCSRGTKTHRKITCCITSPLCVDVPLFAHDTWCLPCDDFRSDTWAVFLNATLRYVNVLFEENSRRRERFSAELQRRLEKNTSLQTMKPKSEDGNDTGLVVGDHGA